MYMVEVNGIRKSEKVKIMEEFLRKRMCLGSENRRGDDAG